MKNPKSCLWKAGCHRNKRYSRNTTYKRKEMLEVILTKTYIFWWKQPFILTLCCDSLVILTLNPGENSHMELLKRTIHLDSYFFPFYLEFSSCSIERIKILFTLAWSWVTYVYNYQLIGVRVRRSCKCTGLIPIYNL